MRADVPVILDANVLADSALGDLLLRLSEEPRLVLPRWTEEIWQETRRTLIEQLEWNEEIADSWIAAAIDAFPEAMVADYKAFEQECANHGDDRHILAAAIRASCETIVTMNVRHFRDEHLERWGVKAVHPDDYLLVRYEHASDVVVNVINAMAKRRKKPMAQMLSRIGAAAPKFAAHIGEQLGEVVPPYDQAIYRDSTEE